MRIDSIDAAAKAISSLAMLKQTQSGTAGTRQLHATRLQPAKAASPAPARSLTTAASIRPAGVPTSPTEPRPADPDSPAAVTTGTDTYYKDRAADFRRRNPGMEPPSYYLEYGDKYAARFASLDKTDLSAQGLQWRDKTLTALQDAMERKRIEDPAGFAALERDPEKFKQFAYGTHPDAYVNSGLFDLSAHDLGVIAATPDLRDVLTKDGIAQTLVTLGKLSPKDVFDIVLATGGQVLREGRLTVPLEIGRIVDRFAHHSPPFDIPLLKTVSSLPLDRFVPDVALPSLPTLPHLNVPDMPHLDMPHLPKLHLRRLPFA